MTGLVENQLYLYNSVGQLLTVIGDAGLLSLDYGFKDMEPGVLEFYLPGDFDQSLLMIDGEVEVYISVGAGGFVLDGDTAFFIRRFRPMPDNKGADYIYVEAFSALHLTQRRVVTYFAGTSYADKVGIPWDDMMREIVDENYGPGASYADPLLGGDPERDLEPWLVVEPDQTWGVAYTHSMPWKIVLDTLRDIVLDVRSGGQYCTFDIVRVGPARFEFRVFLGPRGIDHTADSAFPVIVSQQCKNLVNPSLDINWEDEKNFIYATGQGQKELRVVKTARDDTRIGISPFNRNEFVQDARNVDLADSVQAEANLSLEEKRPKSIFQGTISQTDGCLYKVHWNYGDIVTAEYRGLSIDCYVDSITFSKDANGTKYVEGQLRSVLNV